MDQVFEATDLEAVHHILSCAYGPIRIGARGQRRGMRLVQAPLGPVRLDQVSLGMDFAADASPREALIFAT